MSLLRPEYKTREDYMREVDECRKRADRLRRKAANTDTIADALVKETVRFTVNDLPLLKYENRGN
jgi:hypothetical protein